MPLTIDRLVKGPLPFPKSVPYGVVITNSNEPDTLAPLTVLANGFLPVVTYQKNPDNASELLDAPINDATSALLSGAATASRNSSIQTNYNWRGLHLIIDVTAVGGGGDSITPKITGAPDFLGTYEYDLLVGNPITTTGRTVLKLYPGIDSIPNAAAADILPKYWGVTVTHSGVSSFTYTVIAALEI